MLIRMQWTADAIAKLKALAETHTWDQIGAVFGLTADTVRKKAKDLGIKKRILNKARFGSDIKISDYSDEHGIQAACQKYGVTIDEAKNARRRVRERRDVIRLAMTTERIGSIRVACYVAAQENGFAHLQEDFASWAITYILEGYRATIDQLALSYLQSIVGRSDQEGPARRARMSEFYSDGLKEDHDPEIPGHIAVAKEPKKRNTLYALADKMKFDLKYRAVFLLHFSEGLRKNHIASLLGITSTGVDYALSVIEEQLLSNAQTKKWLAE